MQKKMLQNIFITRAYKRKMAKIKEKRRLKNVNLKQIKNMLTFITAVTIILYAP